MNKSNNYFYYLYEINSCGLQLKETFQNYNELIYYLARHQNGKGYMFDNKFYYQNVYLDDINLNYNDTICSFDNNGERCYRLRPYVFFNEDLSIVDVRNFYDDIISYAKYLANKPYNRYNSSYWRDFFRGYIFRQTPIPHTGKRRGKFYRNVKYGHLVRDLKNPDNKDFIRKRNYIGLFEPYYDLPYKKKSKSWKDNTKKRHQYQKHEK